MDKTARVWEVATGDLLHVLEVPQLHVFISVAWSPDSAFVATLSGDSNITVWDAATGVSVRVLEGPPTPKDWVMCVAWSPVGVMLAAAYDDHAVVVWNATTGTAIQVLRGPTIVCGMSLAWSPDGCHLAAAGQDAPDFSKMLAKMRSNLAEISEDDGEKCVKVWEVATGTCVRVIPNAISVTCVAWSPCGNLLLTSMKGELHVFNLGGGRLATSPAVEAGWHM